MPRIKCTVVYVWCALLIPSLAAAAVPANDDVDNATVVSSLPFGESLDTSDATRAPDDPSCAGNSATIWYRFTPAASMRLEVNTFGSSYDTTLSVYVHQDGGLTQIACVDDTVGLQSRIRLDVEAGRAYWIMVGAYADGPGGSLVFTMQEAPPFIPLQLELTIASTATVRPSTGAASVSGTVTCNTPAVVYVSGELRQKPSHRNSMGHFWVAIECNGTTSWRADVFPQLGRFRGRSLSLFTGGRALVSAYADGYTGDDSWAFASVERTIRLSGSR